MRYLWLVGVWGSTVALQTKVAHLCGRRQAVGGWRAVPETVVEARVTPNLVEDWALVDRVESERVEGYVAWRRLAREMGSEAEDVRRRYAAAGGGEARLLPIIEPWEWKEGRIVGVSDGREVRVQPRVNGDHSLSRSLVVDCSGQAYELGAASDAQLAAWRDTPTSPLPPIKDAITVALAAPFALTTCALLLGVLSHHLQIQVFVI